MWCTGLVALWHVGSSQVRDQLASLALAGEFLTTEPLVNLYDQLLFTIWYSVEENLHKEAFPGPFIMTLPFHIPVTSLFYYYYQIVNIIWNDLVSLLLGTVHLSVELSCITTRT